MRTRLFGKFPWLISTAIFMGCGSFPARGASATTFQEILADTTRETDPTPSPDGKWLAFTSDRGGHGATQIYVIPAEGGEPRQLTDEPDSTRAGTPSWAPDGKSLLYVSTRGKRYNVYSLPFEGGEAKGEPKQLTHAPGSHRFGTYSADGKRIAFYSNRVRPGELYGFNIYVMDADGEHEDDMARQVTDSKGSPGHPTWSSDGKWIAFVAKEYDSTRQQTMEGNILFTKYQLYKVPANGGKEIRLTKGKIDGQPFEDTWPSWSPNGKWIAFGRQVGPKRDVWVMDVSSGKTFPVTTSGNCIKPTWAWDSKSIYYSLVNDKSEDIWVANDLTLKPPPEPPRSRKSRAGSSARKSATRRTQR